MAALARVALLAPIGVFVTIVFVLGLCLPGSSNDVELRRISADDGNRLAHNPPRDMRIPRCPVPDTRPAPEQHDRGPCRFVIRNLQMDNAELLYVTGDGDERRYFIVDYNSSLFVSSYTGDVWRLRSRRGLLLKEFRTPSCAGLVASPEVMLPPCAPPSLGPPQAPSLPPDLVRREFSRERLRACGTDVVLSVDHPSPGMHLLCLVALSPRRGAAFAVALFANALRGAPASKAPVPSDVFFVPASASPSTPAATPLDESAGAGNPEPAAERWRESQLSPETLASITLSMVERLQHPSPHQPAALFTLSGVRVDSDDAVGHAAVARQGLLLFEGGQWVWPAARIGQEHLVRVQGLTTDGPTRSDDGEEDGPGAFARLRVLSIKPRILQVEDFLTEEEVEHIIGLSAGHMFTSGVSMKDEDAKAGHRADEYRTSSQYSLRPTQTDTLLALSRRVQRLTRLPVTHVEQVQVLRYLQGQHCARSNCSRKCT